MHVGAARLELENDQPSAKPDRISHGTSGIAWALLELHNATGEPRFRDAALEAFRYERHCFSPTEQNWPDFRDRRTSFPVYWCHGAAGIALVRLRAWQILKDEALLVEARIALDKVADATPSLANFSLCHGQAGNARYLALRFPDLKEPIWLLDAENIAEQGSSHLNSPHPVAMRTSGRQRIARSHARPRRHRLFLSTSGGSNPDARSLLAIPPMRPELPHDVHPYIESQ